MDSHSRTLVRPCTHKSAGLIDVRLHPNSGANADIFGLRMWAMRRHFVGHKEKVRLADDDAVHTRKAWFSRASFRLALSEESPSSTRRSVSVTAVTVNEDERRGSLRQERQFAGALLGQGNSLL